jgi:phosphatidate cytidylyltransferase
MKELLYRVIVAILGIPLLLWIIFSGGHYFTALITLIIIVGQWEFYKLLQAKNIHVQKISAWLGALILIYYTAFGINKIVIVTLFALLLLIFSWEMFRNIGSALLNTAGTLLAIVYPAIFLIGLLYLRLNLVQQVMPSVSAGWFVIAMFISVWICDTFAYFAGVNFGKHKLFERVSPKKSIEGALAGLIGAILTFVVMRAIGLIDIPLSLAIISGLITGILGQEGDLVESWFKRDAAVKDSSAILPGHGGFLDRFDSLIFISPAYVILLMLWK